MMITNKLYMSNNYVADLRSITAEVINSLEIELINKDYFVTNMQEKGYEEKYVNTLVKNINEYEININITVTDIAVVNTIIAYIDNSAVDLPQEILEQVKKDIEECNQ